MENKEECVRQREQVIQKLRGKLKSISKRKEARTRPGRRGGGRQGKTLCDEMVLRQWPK